MDTVLKAMRLKVVLDQVPFVDDPDVLNRVSSSEPLRAALEMTRPPNLWGVGVEPIVLFRFSCDTGVPLAWVPRREVARELATTGERPMLAAVLTRCSSLVLEDCEAALNECDDARLEEQVCLANEAVAAYRSGHTAAAMALAVSLCEPLAMWASTPRVQMFESREERQSWLEDRRKTNKYKLARFELGRMQPLTFRYDFRPALVLAPVPQFFSPFYGKKDEVPPEALSRHVVAHQPTRSHFSDVNSLVAIMLMASLLREQQNFCEDLGPDEL